MKTFIVLALFFTAVNSSFLRNLGTYALSSLTLDECVTLTEGKFTLAATSDNDLTVGTPSYKATFVSGENTAEAATGTVAEGATKSISWEATVTKTGLYTLTEIKDTTGTDTLTLPEKLPSCVVTVEATINATGTLTTVQEVIEGDETKGTFTFAVEEDIEQPPVVYTAATEGKVISNCKVETKNVVCTPTSEEMEDGKEYTIYYQNGCEASAGTSSTAKVKFTAKESSSFMTLGKIAFFDLALLF